jgi:hypothetical protein
VIRHHRNHKPRSQGNGAFLSLACDLEHFAANPVQIDCVGRFSAIQINISSTLFIHKDLEWSKAHWLIT